MEILVLIRPPLKPAYGVYDPEDSTVLTHVRVALSKLNFHELRHGFRDSIGPLIAAKDGVASKEHYLLLCKS